MAGSYDHRLVALSVAIGMAASYAALDVGGHVSASRGSMRFLWLSGGGVVMGMGIWSMHYVGMLAYRLPVTVLDDWPTVFVVSFGGGRCIGGCSYDHEPEGDRANVPQYWRSADGNPDRSDALHRDGSDAVARDVPLFSRNGGFVHRPRNGDCVDCPVANPNAERDAVQCLAKTGLAKTGLAETDERRPDGSGDSRHALQRDGGSHFHANGCLAAGMDDYVSKPIHPAGLEELLERWTAGHISPEKAGSNAESNDESKEEMKQSMVLKSLSPFAESPVIEQGFDGSELVDRMMGDENLARLVVATFIEDMPRQLAALAEALGSADAPAMQMGAHSIKGAAANVGEPSLRAIAAQLEKLGEAGDLQSAIAIVPELSAVFESLRPHLQHFCDNEV
jgi:HPt (histidine-containing phosphotransfer) domain-containing protein